MRFFSHVFQVFRGSAEWIAKSIEYDFLWEMTFFTGTDWTETIQPAFSA